MRFGVVIGKTSVLVFETWDELSSCSGWAKGEGLKGLKKRKQFLDSAVLQHLVLLAKSNLQTKPQVRLGFVLQKKSLSLRAEIDSVLRAPRLIFAATICTLFTSPWKRYIEFSSEISREYTISNSFYSREFSLGNFVYLFHGDISWTPKGNDKVVESFPEGFRKQLPMHLYKEYPSI